MVIILTWIKELLTFLLFFLAISLMLSMAHLLQAAEATGLGAQIMPIGQHLLALAG